MRLKDVLNRDIRIYAGKGGDLTLMLGFFVIALMLFPFSLGADHPSIPGAAPAFIWIVAMLASLLSLPTMYGRDVADGTLDQLRLSGLALEWVATAKILANWIACLLPLVFIAPALAFMLGMEAGQISRLTATLLLGTPILSAFGGLGAALTMNIYGKTGLVALLVLPLYIPVLIFASIAAASNPATAFITVPEVQILMGFLLCGVPLSALACAAMMRLQD